MFRYEIWKHLGNVAAMIISWAVYWLSFCFTEHNDVSCLIMGVAGIAAMSSTCLLVSHYVPRLFSSFRNYIFQIYLFGIAFQAFVELIVWARTWMSRQVGICVLCPKCLSWHIHSGNHKQDCRENTCQTDKTLFWS